MLSRRLSLRRKSTKSPLMELSVRKRAVSEAATHQAINLTLPPPVPSLDDADTGVRTILSPKGEELNVKETMSLYTTTWNMTGAPLPTPEQLSFWIPKNFDFYAIGLQECPKVSALAKLIFEYLGGESEYHLYKTKEIGYGGVSLVVIAKRVFVDSGVLKMTHINGLKKYEAKSGKGRGVVCMQFHFHNTILAFMSCKLNSDVKGLEKRIEEMQHILKKTGFDEPEVQDIGTMALAKVHHVFCIGDFGTRIVYPADKSYKNVFKELPQAWSPEKWQPLVKSDEMRILQARVKSFESFDEIVVNHPPTAWRKRHGESAGATKKKQSKRKETESSDTPIHAEDIVAPLFEPDFDLLSIFDEKGGGKDSLPSYTDRILFRSMEGFRKLLSPIMMGTSEAVLSSTHVPVFATFNVNGIDPDLLLAWQRISGNVPPQFATKTDRHIVGGLIQEVEEINRATSQRKALKAALDAEAQDEKQNPEEDDGLPKCPICMKSVLEDSQKVELGDVKFHPECFVCSNCSRSLIGVKFFKVDKHWLCETDYNKLYVRDCPRCKKPIKDEFCRCGDSQFHKECFVCWKKGCNIPLIDTETGKFVPFDELDGKPFCMEHYNDLTSAMKFCAVCNSRLKESDEQVSLERKTMKGDETLYFHKACAHCNVCHDDLHVDRKKFIIKDALMYCEADFVRLFGEIPAAPSTPMNPKGAGSKPKDFNITDNDETIKSPQQSQSNNNSNNDDNPDSKDVLSENASQDSKTSEISSEALSSPKKRPVIAKDSDDSDSDSDSD